MVTSLVLSVALACLSAQAPGAPAVTSAPLDGNADFLEGRRLYDSFEFEKASFRFRAATRVALTDQDAARAYMWLGVALGQAGDEASAREAFATALVRDPQATLPPDVPPTLQPIFAAARDSLVPAPAPAPAPPPPAPVESATGPPLLLWVGAGVTGAGVVIGLVGGVVGAVALAQAEDAVNEKFQDDALEKYEGAQRTAWGANVLIGLGGAALVTGAGVVVASAILPE